MDWLIIICKELKTNRVEMEMKWKYAQDNLYILDVCRCAVTPCATQ